MVTDAIVKNSKIREYAITKAALMDFFSPYLSD